MISAIISDKIYGGPKAGAWGIILVFYTLYLCIPLCTLLAFLGVVKLRRHKIIIVFFGPLSMVLLLHLIMIIVN